MSSLFSILYILLLISRQDKYKCVPSDLNVIYAYSTHLQKAVRNIRQLRNCAYTKSSVLCLRNCRVTALLSFTPCPFPVLRDICPYLSGELVFIPFFSFLSSTPAKSPGEIFKRWIYFVRQDIMKHAGPNYGNVLLGHRSA